MPPIELRAEFNFATGDSTLMCSTCGGRQVLEGGQPEVVNAAVTVAFINAHGRCSPVSS